MAYPGLNIKIPIIEQIRGKVSLRIMQLNVEVETKTLDNVFVKIITAVQYKILPEKIYQAFYVLDNPESQIQSYVFDVVRARVPKIKLDDLFSRKDEIANAVKEELKELMNEFGYDIVKGLVTDINPDPKVKIAMNEINEAQRLRIAAMERGEAEKILKVKPHTKIKDWTDDYVNTWYIGVPCRMSAKTERKIKKETNWRTELSLVGDIGYRAFKEIKLGGWQAWQQCI